MNYNFQVWKTVDDYLLAFIVSSWYIGSVIGCYLAAYLLLRKSISFICVSKKLWISKCDGFYVCFLSLISISFFVLKIIEFKFYSFMQYLCGSLTAVTLILFLLPKPSAINDRLDDLIIFHGRIVGGITSGLVYFTAVIKTATINYPSFSPWFSRMIVCLTATWILMPINYMPNIPSSTSSNLIINRVHGEILCWLSTLIFAVFVLFLSNFLNTNINCVNCDDKLYLVDIQIINENSSDTCKQNGLVLGVQHLPKQFFDDPNVRPLIFLCGAKLLAILCSNIPFGFIAFRYFETINVVNDNNCEYEMQCHLITLFGIRLALGALSILEGNFVANRATTFHCLRIYGIIFILNAFIFLFSRFDSTGSWSMNYKQLLGWIIVTSFILCSICIDSFGHFTAISQWSFSINKRPLVLVFAACIEHLIHILLAVIYLSDVSSLTIFVTTSMFIAVSVCFQMAICVKKVPVDDRVHRQICDIRLESKLEIDVI